MSRTIDGSGIDQVLQGAVDNGAVPHVAAIARDIPGARRAWTGAWAGLFNTHFFIDRTTGICASIYTNSLPFITEHEAWKMYGDFEAALYSSL